MLKLLLKTLTLHCVLITSVRAECPSIEDLKDQKTVPDISQVDNETAIITWHDLWPDMDWTECVEMLEVISKSLDEPIILDDVTAKNVSVTVVPCKEVRFEIAITTKGNETINSFATDRSFKTYQSPQTKQNPDVKLEYHVKDGIINLTAVDISFVFQVSLTLFSLFVYQLFHNFLDMNICGLIFLKYGFNKIIFAHRGGTPLFPP